MTNNELQARVLEELDEDPGGGFYTGTEAMEALSEGQRLFVLLTLCLEATGTLPLTEDVCWYGLLATFPAFLLPLRVRIAGGGAKLRPSRLQELDALNPEWQIAPGTPERYAQIGFSLLAVYKQPEASGTSLELTYAASPSQMVAGGSPDIPEEHHLALVDYAVPRLRVKEGAQELQKAVPRMSRFLDAATALGNHVRARGLGQRYDRLPTELERYDRGRLIALAMRKVKPKALQIPQAGDAADGR